MKFRFLHNFPGLAIAFAIIFISGQTARSQVPTVQDCLGAIPVCAYQYVQPLSFQGTGNYPNEINAGQTCPRSCMDGEKNSVWYVISVKTGGMLSFVITPVSAADDYDWAVYNLNSMECSDIYNNAIFMQASCNAAGGPGFQGATGISSANGGTKSCNNGGNTAKWNSDLPVNAGDTYVLCVSNWTQTQSGYTLDFSASTADIFDDVPATISFVETNIGCAGATELYFGFTENLRCLSVAPSDFLLVGPDGTEHIVSSVTGAGCQAGGEQEKFFTIGFYPPMIESGQYELRLTGEVIDLCTNSSNPHSKFFDVELDPLPEVLSGPDDQMVPIGGTAVFQVETIGDTSFRWQFRQNSTAFWQYLTEGTPYSGTNTNALSVGPATFDMGQYQFRCVVSGDCNPSAQSPAATLFVGNALAASASASPDVICFGDQTQLTVNAFGGNVQQPYSYEWSAPGGWTSNLQNPLVEPEATTVYTVIVNDGYNPATSQVTVTVNPLPVPDAGADQTINHGTFTQLQGSTLSGTPPYTYAWQPADSLWNPAIQSPTTRKLHTTNQFNLVVTDGNDCVSLPDYTTVTVTGGPLAVQPVANPASICLGDSSIITALASGGNYPNYFYSWRIGNNEISTGPELTVAPETTTTYSVEISDMFNTVLRQVTVEVKSLPEINLISPDFNVINGIINVCVFDTITIDAGNAGAQYLWSNGHDQQTLDVLSSGISFDFREYWVRVTDPVSGCRSTDSVQIAFTFSSCSYGIDEIPFDQLVKVFPNPAKDFIKVSLDGPAGDFEVQLTDLSGRVLINSNFRKNSPGVFIKEIYISSLSAGSYFVKIVSEKGALSKKLIIN